MRSFIGNKRQNPPFYLDLVDHQNGDTSLVVMDEKGILVPSGTIAKITQEGEMIVFGGLNPQLPLKTGGIETIFRNKGHISVSFL